MPKIPIFDKKFAPTFLAPMQDVTDINFMRLVSEAGAPDVFVTEYLRVHNNSRLEKNILDSVLDTQLMRPVILQLIGEELEHIGRIIDEIKKHDSIKYLDLNLGCPAPKVYRKNVGGALLKDRKKISEIVSFMRKNWDGVLSVKMRLGFDSAKDFPDLIQTVQDSGADFISLHARTVKQLYMGQADHSYTKKAVDILSVPLVANGDITSFKVAKKILHETGCAGLMIGRSVMRNPWIFRQIKESLADNLPDEKVFRPTLADARIYIDKIHANNLLYSPKVKNIVGRLKKFINFIATSVDEDGVFLREMRHAIGLDELLKICDKHLLENGADKKLLSDDPFEGLSARPNHE